MLIKRGLKSKLVVYYEATVEHCRQQQCSNLRLPQDYRIGTAQKMSMDATQICCFLFSRSGVLCSTDMVVFPRLHSPDLVLGLLLYRDNVYMK